jgi:very-short-patch-repair endonuclease
MRAPSKTIASARDLRKAMTLPEVMLWQALRRGGVAGLRFRRQHPIGPYILDFYCAALKLAVEIDGAVHDHPEQVRHDIARDAWLSERGITVLRFNASDVLNEERRHDVLATIASRAPSTA